MGALSVSVADVRSVALTLPRTTEGLVRGHVKFYVGRIVYIAFSRDETLMGFGFPREWRRAAVETGPEKFLMPTGVDLRYNWLMARMEVLGLAEMRECVLDAWSMVVSQRVLDEYVRSRCRTDAAEPPARPSSGPRARASLSA